MNDNIWTLDGDGELRLTIMATMAQEESRKISERSLAGQRVSREKGVLYGNGNIFGYIRNKLTKQFEIDPDQAETVKMIFMASLSPCTILPEEGDSFKYLILPLRM